ncbi:MAG: cobalamin biosynthesis protein [Proteobacteria bacterium]|nr:cobalamin biosynthesis protein [Pseudomonadota bacterium]
MFQLPLLGSAGSIDPLVLIVTALIGEFVIGQFARINASRGHPANLLAGLVGWFDHKLNRPTRSQLDRAVRGTLTLIIILILSSAVGWAIMRAGQIWSRGWIVELVLLVIVLGQGQSVRFLRTVGGHVQRGNMATARAHVARITGVVSELPDEHAIVRSALEWSTTRIVDAALGPIIWYALLGPIGLMIYLAARIMAQTIGYDRPSHQAFGFSAKILDGILNFIPIWLGGLFLAIASLFVGATNPRRCLTTMSKYASSHPLGPGGRTIAAMAGALTVSLGGPVKRDGKTLDAPWLGEGTARAVAHDLRRASYMLIVAGLIILIWLAALAIIRIA